MAQNNTGSQFSLNAFTPSAEYELSIGEKSSIDLDFGLGFSYLHSLGESHYGIYPGFKTQYRYYYNFQKRIDDKRNTSGNSANYIAGIASITGGNPIFGDLKYSSDYGLVAGPAWGLQRVYDNNFKVNVNLGLGFGYSEVGDSYLLPIIAVQLGWVLDR
ncbi:hypothetical protein C7S20_01965 [Christiangramia fulva]|uniref:DUF3575 domain-containing protein n=1 Tax=Christiangramia fulva TaxID=2126553 RepID=A0A2R3Z1J6_9FLAO|nr:hypothetical protein C7S20_01965 [Christiangramia fulva]